MCCGVNIRDRISFITRISKGLYHIRTVLTASALNKIRTVLTASALKNVCKYYCTWARTSSHSFFFSPEVFLLFMRPSRIAEGK